jgi:hypothetical protein
MSPAASCVRRSWLRLSTGFPPGRTTRCGLVAVAPHPPHGWCRTGSRAHAFPRPKNKIEEVADLMYGSQSGSPRQPRRSGRSGQRSRAVPCPEAIYDVLAQLRPYVEGSAMRAALLARGRELIELGRRREARRVLAQADELHARLRALEDAVAGWDSALVEPK